MRIEFSLAWYDVLRIFTDAWRAIRAEFWPVQPWRSIANQPPLREVAADWTWRWEMQEQWFGVGFNAGTEEKPEWVMMR